MKYFARINKENVGPLSLKELVEAGVRPSTYVWCKGMTDWQRAEDDPEICRAMRRYLAGLDPETGQETALARPDETPRQVAETQQENPYVGLRGLPEPENNINYSFKPAGVSVIMAIVATICCFPITGVVAIFYAMRCQADWRMSEQPGISAEDKKNIR